LERWVVLGDKGYVGEELAHCLEEEFGANRAQTRSVKGLLRSLGLKVTALTLGNYLNALMGEPVLQVASSVN
jgi:hypothetical protein